MNSKDLQNDWLYALDVFRKILPKYSANMRTFITLGLLFGFASEITGFVFSTFNLPNSSFVLLISLLLTCWVSIATISAASRVYGNKPVNLMQCFQDARGIFWQYIVVYILASMAIAFGLVALVAPGVFFLVIFCFAEIFVVLEKQQWPESGKLNLPKAFKKSVTLVQGSFFKVFFYLLLFFPIIFLQVILAQFFIEKSLQLTKVVLIFINIFIRPFYIYARVELYYELKKLSRRKPMNDGGNI